MNSFSRVPELPKFQCPALRQKEKEFRKTNEKIYEMGILKSIFGITLATV